MAVADRKDWGREIGERISRIRKEQGLTQTQLADRLGQTPSAVSKLENGETDVTVGRLFEIVETLGYSPAIRLRPPDSNTRIDWGPIRADNPSQRKKIRQARLAAEDVADKLYGDYGAVAVHVFGSLVDQGGDKFYDSSDIDIAVEGLDPEELFDADFLLEESVNQEMNLEPYRTIQLHPVNQLPTPLDEVPSRYVEPQDSSCQ
jgi:transcriptional regulator with XRE-family HTH domain